MSKLQLKGVLPPMITPFKENGDVDYDAFIYNIRSWNESKLAGYLVLGSNSETAYLSYEEKIKLIEFTIENAATNKHIMVGSGLESIRETISLTNRAAKIGANSALLLTPFFYSGKMDSLALVKYYTTVADHTDLPVLIYNVPKFTHVNISADAVAKLSVHPNIIGIKDSSGDVPQLASLKRITGDDFNVMVGTASAWYPALALGIKAGILALANCCPNECAEVQEAFEKGNWEEARNIYLRMLPVNTAVTDRYGIAGLKYACDLLGFKGGFVRSPLQQLSDLEEEGLKNILTTAEVLKSE